MTFRKTAFDTVSDESSFGSMNLPETAQDFHGGLPKFKISDKLAMGGVSDLDRQALLATDVFMCAEDRAAYEKQTAAVELSFSGPQVDLSVIGAPLPPKGPFSDFPSTGMDSAFVPQGTEAPQGLLASPGLLGPQGLLAPQPFFAATAPTQAFIGFSPEPSLNSGSPAVSLAPAAPSEQTVNPILTPTNSGSTPENHFFEAAPLKSGFPSLWDKKGPSPFVEVFSRFFQMVLSLFGLTPAPRSRGGRPEMGTD